MSKKKQLTLEELLVEALLLEEEQPYEVPENWLWTKNGIIGVYHNGKAFKSTDWSTKGRPIIRIQDLTGTNKGMQNYFEGTVPAKHEIKKGDLLISWSATLGAYIWMGEDAVLNQHIFKVESFIDKHYHYYAIKNMISQLMDKTHGSGMVHVTKKVFDNASVPLPPLTEQKRIVEKVERLFSKIDKAKQLIEEAKVTFDLRRAAILDKAFSGELTKEWRGKSVLENPNQRLENIKKERYSVTDTKRESVEVAELFESLTLEKVVDDKGWLYLKANMFCHNITCGGTPSAHLSETGEVPFLKVYNIVNNKIAFEYRAQYIPHEIQKGKLKKSMLQPNDVIMNIVGPPLKKIAIIPNQYPQMNMNQAIVRFRPIKFVLPKFIYYCLQFEDTLADVINETRGVVGQSNISISQSRDLVMPIPSIEEQKIIVEKVESLLNREEKALESLPSIKELESMKQSILFKAFRGELGTNDSCDEPAIELLKELLNEQYQ